MSKSRQLRNDANLMTLPRGPSSSLTTGVVLGAAGVVMALTLLLALMIWAQTRDLNNRFAALENRLAQIATKVDQVGTRAAAPAQRGPDPNRVYTIRTDGAPFKGRKDAPITIAEFSDFQ